MPVFDGETAAAAGQRGGRASALARAKKTPQDQAREKAQKACPSMMSYLVRVAEGKEEPNQSRITTALKILEYGMGRPIPIEKPAKEAAAVPTSENLFKE